MERDFTISPSQGVKLLAVAASLKHGDIEIRGEDDDPANATAIIQDIAQEIALQVDTSE